MILPESRLTTLRFARTYFARVPATRTSVHVKSATPMHRGCITDLLCKSVTFTKTCGGRSSANVRQISVVGTIDSINIISGACKVNASVAHFARHLQVIRALFLKQTDVIHFSCFLKNCPVCYIDRMISDLLQIFCKHHHIDAVIRIFCF